MTEDEKIKIELSKPKLTKLLIYGIVFLLGGLWMLVTNPQTGNSVFDNPILKGIVSYGAILMGLVGIYVLGKKLFNKMPGLIINKDGIYDNVTAFKFGLIPWTDISQIYERTVRAPIAPKQRFVTIGLKNPEKYISREANLIKRKLLKANSKSGGSPIHFSVNSLKVSHKDLLRILDEAYQNYKG